MLLIILLGCEQHEKPAFCFKLLTVYFKIRTSPKDAFCPHFAKIVQFRLDFPQKLY